MIPKSLALADLFQFLADCWHIVYSEAYPTYYAAKLYILFLLFQATLALLLPGPVVKGIECYVIIV